jgi:hypothetical protein
MPSPQDIQQLQERQAAHRSAWPPCAPSGRCVAVPCAPPLPAASARPALASLSARRTCAAAGVALDAHHRQVALAAQCWAAEIEQGAKITEVQRRLGHESAATTTISVEALQSDENPYAEALVRELGVEG